MKDMIKGAWAQILLAFTVGVLGISYKDDWRYATIVQHLGTAFVVAAVVTGFWHLREVSEVIHKYVKAILFDYSYLTKLKLESLTELRSKAARAILEKATDNPFYKRDELEDWIDGLLYSRLLPGKLPNSGLYRHNFVEEIQVEYLTLEEALQSEGESVNHLSASDLQSFVMRITSTTDFTVIAPSISDDSLTYAVHYTGEGCGLANFPPKKLMKMYAGKDRTSCSPVVIQSRNDQGQFIWETEPKHLKFEKGKCRVWTHLVEYKSPGRESFILNTMALLTRNLTVSIHQIGKGPSHLFVGQLIATPADDMKARDAGLYRASLKYDGWLFEDHGYHFHWFESSESRHMEACSGHKELDQPRPETTPKVS